MKHAHVDATLTTGERVLSETGEKIAPWAMLAKAESEPLPPKTRVALVWNGPEWAEVDIDTGESLAYGSTEDLERGNLLRGCAGGACLRQDWATEAQTKKEVWP